MARQADSVIAAKGTRVVELNIKRDNPSDDALAALIIGPSGNLRAPALRIGKKLIVGFEPGMYSENLG